MKIIKKLLYPPAPLTAALIPASAALLIYSFAELDSSSPIALISYVLSAYTLTIFCLRIPAIISFWKHFSSTNKWVVRWRGDVRFRVNLSLFATFSWNFAYGIFQLWLGVYHASLWYYSAAAYYFLLAGMRYFLVRFSRKNEPGERMREELIRYRLCGRIFLLMNLALGVMVALNVWSAREVRHHQITTIALAACTFTSFTFGIINIFRYRKYNSPVFMASKSISLASASVSMLTLTSTMLAVFSDGNSADILFRRLMLGFLGGAVSGLFIGMAVYMVATATKKLKSEQHNE